MIRRQKAQDGRKKVVGAIYQEPLQNNGNLNSWQETMGMAKNQKIDNQ